MYIKATHNKTSETNNKKDGLKVLCKQKKFSYCKAFIQPAKSSFCSDTKQNIKRQKWFGEPIYTACVLMNLFAIE